MALLAAIFFCSVLIAKPCGVSSGSGYGGGGDGWQNGGYQRRVPRDVMVNVINDLGLSLLEVHNEHNENNIAISPYGATSVLVALVEGLTGSAAHEIRYAIRLPQELSIVRIGLRDIHRHLKSYFIPKEGFLAGLTLSHENITLNREYESILRFYGYDVDSFNNPVYPEAFSTTTPPSSTKTAKTNTMIIETTTLPMSTIPPTTTTIEEIARMETDETTETTVASTENLSSLKPERTTRKESSLPDLEKEGIGTTKNVPVRETTKMDSTEDIVLSETRYTTHEYTVTTEMSTVAQSTIQESAVTDDDVMKRESTLGNNEMSTETTTNSADGKSKTTLDNTEVSTEKNFKTTDSNEIVTLQPVESTTEKLFSTIVTMEASTEKTFGTTSLEETTEATTEKTNSEIKISTAPLEIASESTDFPETAAMVGMTTTSPLITTLITTQASNMKQTTLDKQGGDDSNNSEESKDFVIGQDSTTKAGVNSATTEEVMLTSITSNDSELTEVFKLSTTEAIEESTPSSSAEETTKQFSTSSDEESRATTTETTIEVTSTKTDSGLSTLEDLMTSSDKKTTEEYLPDVNEESSDESILDGSKESTEDFMSDVSTETTEGIQTTNEDKNTATTAFEDLLAESTTLYEAATSEFTSTEAGNQKLSSTTNIVRRRRHAELFSESDIDDLFKSEASIEDTPSGKYKSLIDNNRLAVPYIPAKNKLKEDFTVQDDINLFKSSSQIDSSEEAELGTYKNINERNRLKISFVPRENRQDYKSKNEVTYGQIQKIRKSLNKLGANDKIHSSRTNFQIESSIEETTPEEYKRFIGGNRLEAPIEHEDSLELYKSKENFKDKGKVVLFSNIPRLAKSENLKHKSNFGNDNNKGEVENTAKDFKPEEDSISSKRRLIKSKDLSKKLGENLVKDLKRKVDLYSRVNIKDLQKQNINSDDGSEELLYSEFESRKIFTKARKTTTTDVSKGKEKSVLERNNNLKYKNGEVSTLADSKIETSSSENDLEFSSTLRFPRRRKNFEYISPSVSKKKVNLSESPIKNHILSIDLNNEIEAQTINLSDEYLKTYSLLPQRQKAPSTHLIDGNSRTDFSPRLETRTKALNGRIQVDTTTEILIATNLAHLYGLNSFTPLPTTTSSDSLDVSSESYGTFQISANITTPRKPRTKRSVIDYLIARYYDNYYISSNRRYLPPPKPHYSNYQPEVPYTFLVNGKYRESNISFMTYDTVLPFYYIPGLDAMALSFPLDSNMYYLLLVLPSDDQGIDKLIHDFKKVTTLENIVQNLKYTHVKAVIPSFTLKGYVVLTPSLQKLCIRKIFEPRHADFSQLTPEKDIYVTNIEQAVTVTIRNYVDPSSGSGRNLQAYRPVEFKADHPFLYFVMDAQIHVNLMAGKITNPLNSRIR